MADATAGDEKEEGGAASKEKAKLAGKIAFLQAQEKELTAMEEDRQGKIELAEVSSDFLAGDVKEDALTAALTKYQGIRLATLKAQRAVVEMREARAKK